MARDLVIVGAGGLGREAAEAVRAANLAEPTWHLVGFVDDAVAPSTDVEGVPVLGSIDLLQELPEVAILLCTGRPDRHWSRRVISTRLGLPDDRYASVVHPAAVLPAGSEVGPGSLVLAGVVATTRIDLGRHVVVMPGTVFTHDDEVADHVTFGAGVRLAGGVTVGEGAYIGAGALVREEQAIGPWALVGMGAVVTSDIPAGQVWAGNPARHLRSVDLPAELLPGSSPTPPG